MRRKTRQKKATSLPTSHNRDTDELPGSTNEASESGLPGSNTDVSKPVSITSAYRTRRQLANEPQAPLLDKPLDISSNSGLCEEATTDIVEVGEYKIANEGSDPTSHQRRKANKRELKAMLKQTKKSRGVIDENVAATLDELADHLKADCVIDLNPPHRRPIQVAPDPRISIPLTAAIDRRGVGGRKGGRRGSKRGRGAKSMLSVESRLPTIPASWFPLILPYCPPSTDNSKFTSPKPSFAPWLHQLSEIRIQRFTHSMSKFHSLLYASQASFAPPSDYGPHRAHHSIGQFDASQPLSLPPVTTPNSITEDSHHTTTPISLPIPEQPVQQTQFSTTVISCEIPSSTHASEIKSLIESNENVSVPTTPQIPLKGRSRGRGRRSLNRGRFVAGRGSNMYRSFTPTETVLGTWNASFSNSVAQPELVTKSKAKPRIPRELRSLVTWDAMIAREKLEKDQAIHSVDETQPGSIAAPRHVDVTLAVAEDFLAQASVSASEGGMIIPRTRHSRQSSGTTSKTQSSVIHSDASESATEIIHPKSPSHQKSMDNPTISCSSLSTTTSSTVSDLPSQSIHSAVDQPSMKSSQAARLSVHHSSPNSHLMAPKLAVEDSHSTQTLPAHDVAPVYSSKYSPISVDHDTEGSLSNEHSHILDVNDIGLTEKSISFHKRGKSKRGKTHAGKYAVTPSPVDSSSSLTGARSTSVTSTASPLLTSLSTFKRKRSAHVSPEHTSVQTVCMESVQQEIPASSPADLSSTTRRTTTSKSSSALPPRKRYKVSLELTPVETEEINKSEEIISASCLPVPDYTTNPESIDLAINNDNVAELTNIQIPKQPVKRGGKRGRPHRQSVSHVLVEEQTTAIPLADSQNLSLDRPKREAAALGYASLVSASLNNSVHGTSNSLESPVTRISGSETPVGVADMSGSTADPTATLVVTASPRGRGRPPKRKVIKVEPAVDLSTADISESQSSTPSSLPAIGRRKRPAVVLSPGGKTYIQAYTASTTPDTSTQTSNSPSAESQTAHVTPNAQKFHSPRVLDNMIKPKTEVHGKHSSQRIPVRDSDEIPAISLLPKHCEMFKGHLLTDSIPSGMNCCELTTGPLWDMFVRFLNEPDPCDPTSRLAAPIIFLPSPERYPEFYYFVLSSCTGAAIRTRFTKTYMQRIFNPSIPMETDGCMCGVEFPSLCLASIARRFLPHPVDPLIVQKLTEDLQLSESELGLILLNACDAENCMPLLDAAIDNVLGVWESFAGRRSWLGRRLARLRSLYSTLRLEFTHKIADEYGQMVPPSKATAILNMPNFKVYSTGVKKKSDRRALERGAEVIRCLCGFRVEGGHAMVQCDRCASWQHVPCLWWALNLIVRSEASPLTKKSQLCRAVLHAAQVAYSGGVTDTIDSHHTNNDIELPYFCPMCLGLSGLTLEYPRSLSAAMALDDLDSVASLQETTTEGEREFWSLSSVDGAHQIRTDDYAFIHRRWLDSVLNTPVQRIDLKVDYDSCPQAPELGAYAHDYIIVRIYRLWKEAKTDRPWLEGGLFLRPYDLPTESTAPKEMEKQRQWHQAEVVYDESSRILLPLSAWITRCTVLSPSAYRSGRPADLMIAKEAEHFLSTSLVHPPSSVPLSSFRRFFVCDKLFQRTQDVSKGCLRFDEISPGYLKVNTRPYCFLRKPDASYGRVSVLRNFNASQLLEDDKITLINEEDSTTNLESVPNVLPPSTVKGHKLARVVNWLERKRQLDVVPKDQVAQTNTGTEIAPVPVTPDPPIARGSRGKRGRGRPPKRILHASSFNHPAPEPSIQTPTSLEENIITCSQIGDALTPIEPPSEDKPQPNIPTPTTNQIISKFDKVPTPPTSPKVFPSGTSISQITSPSMETQSEFTSKYTPPYALEDTADKKVAEITESNVDLPKEEFKLNHPRSPRGGRKRSRGGRKRVASSSVSVTSPSSTTGSDIPCSPLKPVDLTRPDEPTDFLFTLPSESLDFIQFEKKCPIHVTGKPYSPLGTESPILSIDEASMLDDLPSPVNSSQMSEFNCLVENCTVSHSVWYTSEIIRYPLISCLDECFEYFSDNLCVSNSTDEKPVMNTLSAISEPSVQIEPIQLKMPSAASPSLCIESIIDASVGSLEQLENDDILPTEVPTVDEEKQVDSPAQSFKSGDTNEPSTDLKSKPSREHSFSVERLANTSPTMINDVDDVPETISSDEQVPIGTVETTSVLSPVPSMSLEKADKSHSNSFESDANTTPILDEPGCGIAPIPTRVFNDIVGCQLDTVSPVAPELPKEPLEPLSRIDDKATTKQNISETKRSNSTSRDDRRSHSHDCRPPSASSKHSLTPTDRHDQSPHHRHQFSTQRHQYSQNYRHSKPSSCSSRDSPFCRDRPTRTEHHSRYQHHPHHHPGREERSRPYDHRNAYYDPYSSGSSHHHNSKKNYRSSNYRYYDHH